MEPVTEGVSNVKRVVVQRALGVEVRQDLGRKTQIFENILEIAGDSDVGLKWG